MSETAAWITDNLSSKAVYSGKLETGELSFRVTDAEVSNCVCNFTATMQISGGPNVILKPQSDRLSIPMTAIDRRSMKVESKEGMTPPMTWLAMSATGKVIQSQDAVTRRVSMADGATIYFPDKATAERFLKAFDRLAFLCQQQKKEPF